MDIAQKPNKSGQILDQCWKIFFVIFTKLIPRRMFFFVLQKVFGVDGNSPTIKVVRVMIFAPMMDSRTS